MDTLSIEGFMRLPQILLIVLRVLAGIQIVLGLGFWTGHWYGLVPIHRARRRPVRADAVGYRRARTRPPASTGVWPPAAIAWGVCVAALGFAQQYIMPRRSALDRARRASGRGDGVDANGRASVAHWLASDR